MAGQGYNNRRGLGFGQAPDPMMDRRGYSGGATFDAAPDEMEDDGFMLAGKQEEARDDSAYDQGWDEVDEAEFMKWLRSQPPGVQQRLLDSYRYGQEDSYGAMGDDEYYPSYRRRSDRGGAFAVEGEPGAPKREKMYDYYHGEGERPGDVDTSDANMRDDSAALGGRSYVDPNKKSEGRPTRRTRTPRMPSDYERR